MDRARHHAVTPLSQAAMDLPSRSATVSSMDIAANTGTASSLRTAVRACRRSVRAGAFACELATRRPWLGPRDAQWIAENLIALRGLAVEVAGARGGVTEALVLAEPCATSALAILSAIPGASIGPSLAARGEPWWPRAGAGPVLLSIDDGDELGRLARERARIVPVAVELSPRPSGARLWPTRTGVTHVRLWLGAPLELGPPAGDRASDHHDVAVRARREIACLIARAV
jgi:hypothetical protein